MHAVVHTHIQEHTQREICIYLYIYIHMFMYKLVQYIHLLHDTGRQTDMHTCSQAHTHTYTNAHIQTRTHSQIRAHTHMFINI